PLETPRFPTEVRISLVDEAPSLRPLTTERRKSRQQGCTAMARFTPQQLWLFAAYRDGAAIGETMLCCGAGVAGLYNVEVLEPFRGQGIGSALVHSALLHARKLGFRAAVLGATGMGARIYTRMNFHEVCKISFWKYGKMRQL